MSPEKKTFLSHIGNNEGRTPTENKVTKIKRKENRGKRKKKG
jgi:hypothetical protein